MSQDSVKPHTLVSFSFLWSVTFSPDRQLGVGGGVVDWRNMLLLMVVVVRGEWHALTNEHPGFASEKWRKAASGNMEYWQVYWRDEVILSPYLGLWSSNGNQNHPFVIWKPGASIPLKGFLFCRLLVMLLPETLCQLMFACFWNGKAPSNCFSHYTVLRAGRLPACGSLSPSHHLGLARGPFKGQGNANYFPSWHLHERYNICPLGGRLLKGNWEFGSLSNSHNHRVSGTKGEMKNWNNVRR